MSAPAIRFDRSLLTAAARTCEQAKQMREEARRARASRVRPCTSGDERLTKQLDEALRKVENLEIALRTARQIGMALGIVMCRYGLTEDDAFAALRALSQKSHRKLREIAEQVVLTGDLHR
jgi:AmiR/NasT family two-component response regulator